MGRYEFNIGDIIRLKTGKSPIIVIKTAFHKCHHHHTINKRPCLRGRYLSSLDSPSDLDGMTTWRDMNHYTLYTDEFHRNNTCQSNRADYLWRSKYQQQQEEEQNMTKLYQTNEEPPRFGTFLTMNSSGKMVIEMKGEHGAVEVFDKKDLEEVIPHTIILALLGTEQSDQQNLQCPKDSVKTGQVLLELNTGLMWRVTAVDTKCRSASVNKSKWLAIETKPFTFGGNPV